MDGYVTVRVESNDPARFVPGASFPGPDDNVLIVEQVRDAEKGIHLKFSGRSTRESAEALRGHRLTVPPDARRDLGDGEFWPDELVGLLAFSQDGATVGVVTQFVEGNAQDRLRIRTDSGTEFEVPFVLDLVPAVDVPGGSITINLLAGFID